MGFQNIHVTRLRLSLYLPTYLRTRLESKTPMVRQQGCSGQFGSINIRSITTALHPLFFLPDGCCSFKFFQPTAVLQSLHIFLHDGRFTVFLSFLPGMIDDSSTRNPESLSNCIYLYYVYSL